ncbi:MAG: single-stranded DNA-binding protein [Candidatus Omnitrophota bacterium]
MNVAVVSGRLAQNAVVFGKEAETLKFSVACPSGYDSAAQEAKVDFVPCVIFRAPEKLRELLAAQGKGKPVELRGRIITSSYEHNGAMRYATEVVVDARDFHLLRTGAAQYGRSGESGKPNPMQKGDFAYASSPMRQPSAGRDFYGPGIVGH